MEPFTYQLATFLAKTGPALAEPATIVVAGGTNVVDLLQLGILRPKKLLDISRLPLVMIGETPTKGVRVGANTRNAMVADHPGLAKAYPVLVEALLAGAPPRIRNVATVAGNLLQRTRCPYFRDVTQPCNKRTPGAGCSAIGGFTRSHAVLGTSESCLATHASDMCVALLALDAIIHVHGPAGDRAIPIGELHTLPGDHPEIEHTLKPGELIIEIELPPVPFAAISHYVKAADRAAGSFALASAAVGLEMDGRKIRSARIALGGVATKPWRALEAEQVLIGQPASVPLFAQAAAVATKGAVPHGDNAFKIPLAQHVVARALGELTGLA